METGLDISAIKNELNQIEREETEPGTQERRVFIGTVFNLTPSGKYYVPFACSNVTEEEAEQDQEWYEIVEEELSEHGLFLTSSEGDPCDLLVGELRDV